MLIPPRTFPTRALVDETEKPIAEDATDTDDKAEQESPKIGGKFDIADLRLSEDYAEGAGVKKLLTTIPVDRSNPQKYFRVNADPAYQLQVATIEIKVENEVYIVLPKILPEMPEEFKNKLLVAGITRSGVLLIWPLGLPDPDGKDNHWHRSAREAASYAQKAWIRMISNREFGATDKLSKDPKSYAPTKIVSIITAFEEAGADPKLIAKKEGFRDHKEMAEYMTNKGHEWNAHHNNYVKTIGKVEETIEEALAEATPTVVNHDIDEYMPFIRFLYEKRDDIYQLISGTKEDGTIPRYVIPGIVKPKNQ